MAYPHTKQAFRKIIFSFALFFSILRIKKGISMKLFLIAMATLAIAACGQKGDLYLPDHTEPGLSSTQQPTES